MTLEGTPPGTRSERTQLRPSGCSPVFLSIISWNIVYLARAMADSKKFTGPIVKIAFCGGIGLVVTFVTPSYHQKRQELAVGMGSESGSSAVAHPEPSVTVGGNETLPTGDDLQSLATETTTYA